jgi:serine/threonine-protein kinase
MKGSTVLDRYKIIDLLGCGGMGMVYLARSIDAPDTRVVIKCLHEKGKERGNNLQMFLREAESMARFRHPYAVHFIEAGLDRRHGPCIVMEYLAGITLKTLLAQSGRICLVRTANLLGQLCHALDAAHRVDIIHRDLKPANLMILDPEGSNESLRVLDLGLAKMADRPHFHLEQLAGDGLARAAGTVDYMCPEQLRGNGLDARGDIYTVGVILYEMLIGQLPFERPRPEMVLRAHLEQEPPRFSDLCAGHGIPDTVELVIRRCLAKYPIERPQTVRELASEFGYAMGCDIWEATQPVEELVPTDDTQIPAPAPVTTSPPPSDPNAIIHQFDTFMNETMAVVKLRGFLEEVGAKVVDSEPGYIRVILAKEGTTTSWFSWFNNMFTQEPPTPEREPMEIELVMEKGNQHRSHLQITAYYRPKGNTKPRNPRRWKTQCDNINSNLKAFLMG